MDHREFLGDTVEKIAFEKAGIIKRGSPLVIGQQDERAVQVCLEIAAKLRVEALVGGQDFQAFEENGRLVYQDQDALLDLPLPRLLAVISKATQPPPLPPCGAFSARASRFRPSRRACRMSNGPRASSGSRAR